MERLGDATRMIAYIVKHSTISIKDIEALSSDVLAKDATQAEYEKFNRDLQDCNDPNGPHLGARGDSQHEYRKTMSTPPQPCQVW